MKECMPEEDKRYHVDFIFSSKEVAVQFVDWMANGGESSMWQHAEDAGVDLNREVTYDYEVGSLEIKDSF